jgi:hypothetical protein
MMLSICVVHRWTTMVPSIYVVQWGTTKVRKSHVNQVAVKRTSVTKASTPATDHTSGISKVWADLADNPIGLGLGSRIVSAKWSQCNFKFAEFEGNVPGNTFVGSSSTVL